VRNCRACGAGMTVSRPPRREGEADRAEPVAANAGELGRSLLGREPRLIAPIAVSIGVKAVLVISDHLDSPGVIRAVSRSPFTVVVGGIRIKTAAVVRVTALGLRGCFGCGCLGCGCLGCGCFGCGCFGCGCFGCPSPCPSDLGRANPCPSGGAHPKGSAPPSVAKVPAKRHFLRVPKWAMVPTWTPSCARHPVAITGDEGHAPVVAVLLAAAQTGSLESSLGRF
jgi:hypothetical protein